MKNYCALIFFKTALLKDPHGLLNPARRASAGDAANAIHQAWTRSCNTRLPWNPVSGKSNEKAGLKVSKMNPSELEVPEEFPA
ncbi:uncharacterized protein YdeI (YjbR/CyaY-like superfamily) [Lewinella marina]|uniref:hypothetical protein n=1 Tax=Neolewinella marina TaxID=438751 RepID=UPI00117ABE85|nr:hypothetical protein [Neolewinella marina]NJB87758.1 uncharacterized protein YdeI (YjbR/CyaY-like superfamily) [Neolewinella marina]